jgi:broad specificity phosphatase PhoE
MPRLYLVRHGKAAASWDQEYDPGLNDLGRTQAQQAANTLSLLEPIDIITSPLTRAKETSRPLAELWDVRPRVESRVGEIPSSTDDLVARTRWLRTIMREEWSKLGEELSTWRGGVLKALWELDRDTVVFSHFIAINVVVGKASGDDRVVCFWPDNGSITQVEVTDSSIKLIEKGVEGVNTLVG